jgi:anti-sigma regulatory factor (Ser/Thr protein kinase)
MRQLHFQPIAGKTPDILDAILRTPEVASSGREAKIIRLVCEELVVNVVDYAYPDREDGYLDVNIDKDDRAITIQLKDGGVPFNPLEREMPDTTIPLKERRIGGLGIFITIKKMDDVKYEYVNNENVLTIKKNLSNEE